MLIIGGTFPLTKDCDAAPQWGTHNLVLGQQADPDAIPWQLYSPNLTTYAVPDIIRSVIGGAATGAATKTQPAGGFDNPDLDVLMTKKASVAARTPTRAIPGATGASHAAAAAARLGTGAIAGIAVGAAALLAAALGGLCVLVRRRRRRRQWRGADSYATAAGRPGGGGGKGSVVGDGSSSGYHPYGPGGSGSSPWRSSPHSNFSSLQSPSSYGPSPASPFARRPSNLNIQQGPAELPASAAGDEYEMERVGDGGGVAVTRPLRLAARGGGSHGSAHGPVLDQPKFDEHGRPWYPQISVVDDAVHSPTSHSSSTTRCSPGAYPYSPQIPRSPPQELSTHRSGSTSGWDEGGTGSPTAASMLMGEANIGDDGRHTTFYHA